MPVYERGPAEGLEVVDCWKGGVGWLAHPDEAGRRVSHAVRVPTGDERRDELRHAGGDERGGERAEPSDGSDVWVFDPLDAPGVDDLLADLAAGGEVAGVAVLAAYHARDAGAIARRHDVPVTVPDWFSRVADRVDAPVERTQGPIAGFDLERVRPLHAWEEAVAYRQADRTLYVPDYLSSHPKFCVAGERVGMPTLSRLAPPRSAFAGFDPDRLLFGHGQGIFESAAPALADTLARARRRFPRALVSNLPGETRAMLGALR